MREDEQPNICVVTESKVVRRTIEELAGAAGFSVSFLDTDHIAAADLDCGIFVVDADMLASASPYLRQQLAQCSPAALTLALSASAAPESAEQKSSTRSLPEGVDWVISYDQLRQGLLDALRVLEVIRRKARRGVAFDEFVAATRSIKHDASNALALAVGAFGRLAKASGVADHPFFEQVRRGHERMAEQLQRLDALQEETLEPGDRKSKKVG